MENIKQAFNERTTRMKNVINGVIPDRVPVVLNAQTYVMNYAGISVKKAFMEDPDLLFEAYKKYLTDIYNDAILDVSNTATMNIAQLIGSGIYEISDNWIQIKGGHGCTMEPSEYPEFIKDPNSYIANVIAPRKFPVFNQSFEKNVELMKKIYEEFGKFGKHNAHAVKRIEEEVGVPLMVNGVIYNPMDFIMDFFRDFTGITMDIKRNPSKLYDACGALYDYQIGMFNDSNVDPHADKLLFSPLHIPTYLNLKDFEKTYYPWMKKYVEDINVNRGYAMYFFMENNWKPYLDFLKDLPEAARIVMLFEYGDLKEIKEAIGEKYVIMGGMPISLLGYSDVAQCKDKVKQCIDDLAPGGNYIFSIDRILMSTEEAKTENVIETAAFAHEYGVY